MPYVMVGNENGTPIYVHYEDFGSGKPIILIHGWPLSGRSWEKQVPALVDAGYRVIVYDRRGFGQSSQPWEGYNYDTLAADLHQLIMNLNLNDVTLVGFSMGGGEVARYIGTYGTSRISKAVLASAVTPYLYRNINNPEGALDDATIKMFEDGIKQDRIAFLDQFMTSFFTAGQHANLVSEPFRLYTVDIGAFASPKGTLDTVYAFSFTDFRGDLARFNVPTLIIHGDSDAIIPFQFSGKRTHEMLPFSQLVLIEGGPHGIIVTHAEQFNEALIQFLQP